MQNLKINKPLFYILFALLLWLTFNSPSPQADIVREGVEFTQEDGTSPTVPYRVKVNHTDNGDETITITSPKSQTGWTDDGTNVRLTTSSDNVGIGNSSPQGLLDVGTTPGKGLIVLTNSKVGIGTTDPTEKLQIAGNIQATSGIYSTLRVGGTEVLSHIEGTGTAVHGLGTMSTQNANAVNISGGTGLFGSNSLQVGGTGVQAHLEATGTNVHGLGTISTQAANNVSITGGSITGITDLVVGDGGTGGSSFTAYAVIAGGTSAGAPLQAIAGLGSSGQVLTSNGAGALPTFQSAGAGGWSDDGTTVRLTTSTDNVGIGNSLPQGMLDVGTVPGVGLIVFTSGRVGIGITNPTEKLHVSGNVLVNGDLVVNNQTSGDIGIDGSLGVGLTVPSFRLHIKSVGTGTGTTLRIQDADGLNKITILDDGNVGIGNTNPTYKLLVAGSGSIDTLILTNALQDTYIVAGITRDTEWDTEGEVQTVWGGANIILATEIDTSSELAGILGDETGSGLSVFNNAPTIHAPYVKGAGTGTTFALRVADSTPTDRLVVRDDGNVGIGNTAPQGLLDVGTVAGKGLIVLSSGKVGIGTTNPAQALQVIGAIKSSDTYPLYALVIYNPDSSFDGIAKQLSKQKNYTITSAYHYITGGTNVIFTLKVSTTGTGPYTNLLIGSTATTVPLEVTSFVGGSTVPSGSLLILDTVSTSGSGTGTIFNLTVQGYES